MKSWMFDMKSSFLDVVSVFTLLMRWVASRASETRGKVISPLCLPV